MKYVNLSGHRSAALTVLLLLASGPARAAPVAVSVPQMTAQAGAEVDVPLTVKGAKGMSALQMLLTYDPTVLEVVTSADDPDKGVSKGRIVPERAIAKVYTETPGRLPVLFLGGADEKKQEIFSVQEDGVLLTIRFKVIGQPGQKSALTLEKVEAFQTNDMDMQVKAEGGSVTVERGIPWLWIAIAGGILLLLILALATRRKRNNSDRRIGS